MKRIVLIVMLLIVGIIFAGCDVTYDIKKDNSIIITVECDEDDVDEFGEAFDFDEGDLKDKDDFEDVLDDVVDEYDDLEGEIVVKDFKRDKNDDFTLVLEFIPNDDIEDAINDGIAIGEASDILDFFADEVYDDDFDDVYEDEFSEDVDDEKFYVFDKNGDEMKDKEMEEYFDKANTSKLMAAIIEGEDIDVYVPGKIEIIISPDDSVDIDEGAISFEDYAIIVYKTGGSVLGWVIAGIILVCLGVAGYFGYEKKWFDKILKKGSADELDVELDAE